MSGPRVVLIGAGSASFGLGTLAGLMRTPSLSGATLVLVDLDEAGLEAVAALATRLNAEWRAGMRIERHTDRLRALAGGADFVVVSVASDREAAWQRDRELGRRAGIEHYAENGGPGGLFHAARSIELVLPVARDVERCCPDAWLIVYTNPLPRVCRAVARETRLRVVGLCHQLRFGYMIAGVALAERLGIEVPAGYVFRWTDESVAHERAIGDAARERLSLTAAGLNHFTWMLSLRDRQTGEELLPALREALTERVHAGFEPLTRQLVRATGLVPVSGDTHISEYLPYTASAERFAACAIPHYDHAWSERRRQVARADALRLARGEGSVEPLRDTASEGLEELVEAVWHDTGALQESINLPNPGSHLGLPPGAIVELPARAARRGLEPVDLPDLPQPALEWCRRETALVEAVVDAALEPSEANAKRALLLDPMVADLGAVETLARAFTDARARI
ncbi:MAG: hypothetical protein H6744_20040 [Deltaproteobacteria bacterium]|nr:hypothetical protein [Deltaproteobacteria bacterium]